MKRLLSNKATWLLIVLVLLGSAAWIAKSQSNPTTRFGKVTRTSITQRVTVAGTVIPNRKTIITPPYNAYIRKLFVKIGDQVKPGDPVVTLAQTLNGSEQSYPLRAPFPGTVVQVLRSEGEYIETAGTSSGSNTIARIDDMSKLLIDATAPEIDVPKLKLGQEVIVKASALLNRSYKGKIISIALAAKEQRDWDKSRVEFPVTIEILDKDDNIKPGMSVIIDIITNKVENTLALAHEYIETDGEKYFVVGQNGKRKPIQVGIQNDEVFEVKSGVTEGEQVQQADFLRNQTGSKPMED